MSELQRFPVYRATVRDESGTRDLVTVLSPVEVERAGGLDPRAVVGELATGAELTPENLRHNPRFVELLHDTIREAAPRIPELVEGAKRQREGWILIHDVRSFGRDSELAGRDAIGAFPIEEGGIHAGSYTPNPHHHVLTEHGIVTPHPAIQDALLAALRAPRRDDGAGR